MNKFQSPETMVRCVPMASVQAELGWSFAPILNEMMVWSERHLCPPDYVNPYRKTDD
ncbi:MAG: hypothetical protein K2O18_01815 [Oscillospiraceae bacterium]|nr:hypothetical protein [Oscillospiraceae bacterium]